MKNTLITGATGNVGYEVIRYLHEKNSGNEIVAGVRDPETAANRFTDLPNVTFRHFDFENPDTFPGALDNIERLFLVRPPHLSDVQIYFEPLLQSMTRHAVNNVVFLSVQGAEKSNVIPHRRIEKLITEKELNYIFLRPGYFMQNLTTTLLTDIRNKQKIFLPTGKAKFNWIDVKNIGEVAAILLERFHEYQNAAFDLTGYENEDFYKIADYLSKELPQPVRFQNVNPLHFYQIKKKEGLPKGMILVMIMLHFLPRFQKAPRISGFYEQLTGKKPTTLKEFIRREKKKFNVRLANTME